MLFRPARSCGESASITRRGVDVFDQQQLVMFLVVNELVDGLRGEYYSEPARPQASLFTNLHMPVWLVVGVRESCVFDFGDVKSLTGILYRVDDRFLQPE